MSGCDFTLTGYAKILDAVLWNVMESSDGIEEHKGAGNITDNIL